MQNEAAIDEAIDWAVKQNLLEGLIKEQQAEVRMNLLTDFDQEQYDRIRRREGYEDGIAQGAQQNAIETAKRFLAIKSLSDEQIAQGTNLPLEKVLELKESITEKA